MKLLILILTSVLSTAAFGQAATPCAFGEATWELSDMLKFEGKGKIFYQSEHLSLARRQRIHGLTKTEREMILIALKETAAGNAGTELERLETFSAAEGYVTYFSHNSNGGEYAAVASYPGDNEFGVIFKLKRIKRSTEYEIDSVAATIEDGDIAKCVIAPQPAN